MWQNQAQEGAALCCDWLLNERKEKEEKGA